MSSAGSSIEVIRPRVGPPPKLAVFDFDGTVSLIRGGWTDVMVDMMHEGLEPLRRSDESVAELKGLIRRFVLEGNGAPTRLQMERYVREIQSRGGHPDTAAAYHAEYLDRLGQRMKERKGSIAAARSAPEDHAVPGTRPFLQALFDRGIEITLASGTEIEFIREESGILLVDHFFENRLFGPGYDAREFTKARVIDELLTRHGCGAEVLIGFGDGVVETRVVSELGGYAIGVACDEIERDGRVDPAKRESLIAAGASAIIADYTHVDALLAFLWPAGQSTS